jgi:hypothetical protein
MRHRKKEAQHGQADLLGNDVPRWLH